mmetsp:Transcript_19631/g.35631  ORF Transcript_19631/g.35631 Transcript_19631/m.35631 type:complete len:98 (-) Transcript_19631:441-734(-)
MQRSVKVNHFRNPSIYSLSLLNRSFAQRYILFGLTVLAWILSIVSMIVSIAGCTFVQVGGVKIGLFKRGYDGISCERYPSGTDFSGTFATARAFGVL